MRSWFFKRRPQLPESSGEVRISAPEGLHAGFARRVTEVARGFRSSVTLVDGRGRRANAHSMLELLLLGACYGSAVQVSCVGDDADTAFAAVADVLAREAVAA